MKCIICQSNEIYSKKVKEEIQIGNNIIYIPIKTLVCNNCGERYYDRKTMKYMEDIEKKIKKTKGGLKEVGKVLVYNS